MNDTHVANIGAQEQKKRFMFGIFMLIVGVLLLALFLWLGLSRWWRLVLILPLWLGGLGIFQSKEET